MKDVAALEAVTLDGDLVGNMIRGKRAIGYASAIPLNTVPPSDDWSPDRRPRPPDKRYRSRASLTPSSKRPKARSIATICATCLL